MTETREPAETGGYASLEEDDEDLSPEAWQLRTFKNRT